MHTKGTGPPWGIGCLEEVCDQNTSLAYWAWFLEGGWHRGLKLRAVLLPAQLSGRRSHNAPSEFPFSMPQLLVCVLHSKSFAGSRGLHIPGFVVIFTPGALGLGSELFFKPHCPRLDSPEEVSGPPGEESLGLSLETE